MRPLHLTLIITFFSLTGLIILAINIDPYAATPIAKILFFSTLFMTFMGFTTLLLQLIKNSSEFAINFRRGTMLAAALTLASLVSRIRSLPKFSWLVVLIIFVGVEFLLSLKNQRSSIEDFS